MSVVTRNGITTVTPTPWKWYVGAGAFLVLSSWVGGLSIFQVAIAAGIAAMGTGYLYRIVLDREGFSHALGPSKKRHSWTNVTDFKVNTMRYGLFSVAQQVAFTEVNKAGTLGGQLAKFVSGGTGALPVYGIEAPQLVRLMNDYQIGRVPADTPLAAAPASGALNTSNPAGPAPRAKPAQSAPVKRPTTASDRPNVTPRPPSAGLPSARHGLGQGQDPLVQDSAARRRATRNSPLG